MQKTNDLPEAEILQNKALEFFFPNSPEVDDNPAQSKKYSLTPHVELAKQKLPIASKMAVSPAKARILESPVLQLCANSSTKPTRPNNGKNPALTRKPPVPTFQTKTVNVKKINSVPEPEIKVTPKMTFQKPSHNAPSKGFSLQGDIAKGQSKPADFKLRKPPVPRFERMKSPVTPAKTIDKTKTLLQVPSTNQPQKVTKAVAVPERSLRTPEKFADAEKRTVKTGRITLSGI